MNPNQSGKLAPIFLVLLSTAYLLAGSSSLGIPLNRKANTNNEPTSSTVTENQTISISSSPPVIINPPTIQTGEVLYRFNFEKIFLFGGDAGSDCWGYTSPTNVDYAFMGIDPGIVFVNATTFEIIDTLEGTSCTWQDFKTYSHYCYAVSECETDLIVIDLQYLPDSVHLVSSTPVRPQQGHVSAIHSSHNISIDTVQGFLYAEGGGMSSSVLMFDLANPEFPAFVGGFGNFTVGVHDIYAINDTVYLANATSNSYSVWDLSDKLAPELLVVWARPSAGFAHNIWPNTDGTIALTTEETPGKTVKVWDISDLENIQLLGEYLAPGGLAHNVHMKGDTAYISHYESGMRVVDISDPTNPIEIGFKDTYGGESSNFNGCWGMYPFSPNGLVYGSNINGALYIMREELEPIFDTLSAVGGITIAGTSIRVDINASNSHPVHEFRIPIEYSGPASLTLDSVSRIGLRSQPMEKLETLSVDPTNRRIAYSLKASTTVPTAALAAGDGPILSMYFTAPVSAPEGPNDIKFKSFNGIEPRIADPLSKAVIVPAVNSGSIEVTSGCCALAGDANSDSSENIADVTFLIARIFSGGEAPNCADQADANGDNTFNIADITYMIVRVFGGGPAPICGTTGA